MLNGHAERSVCNGQRTASTSLSMTLAIQDDNLILKNA